LQPRMPYTLSHPLAVIPLRRCCPAYLNFPALVTGSMAPDFGYFVDQFYVAKYAHTLPGAVAVCLPASLVLLGAFYLLRRPLCFILPQPHRAALTPLASANSKFTFRALIVACISILIGTLTHIAWDSFTHDYGWPVQYFAILRTIPFQFHRYGIPTYFLLQLLSTIVGAAGLIVLYVAWLRRQPMAVSGTGIDSDAWRFLLLTAIVIAALAISLAIACYHMWPLEQDKTIEVLYWTAVYSISVFFPLLALSSTAADALRKRVAD
jgi:hypothetical protein